MIYLSITTIPSRIGLFKDFYDNILSGSIIPNKIILNIYEKSLRGTNMIVPEYLNELKDLIIIKYSEDYGPILKFVGVFNNFIKDDDIFVYCDDDIKYHHRWLEYMVKNIESNPGKISGYAINSGVNLFFKFRYLKFNHTNSFLRGFGGVGFYKRIINEIDKNDIIKCLSSIEIKLSDDLIISYFINKKSIDCVKIDKSFKEYCEPYDIASNSTSISQGANNTIKPNKDRYYNISLSNSKIYNQFCLESYLFNLNKSDKYIHHEFDKIKNRLLRNEYFTFVRFGDGEINYIEREVMIHPEHTTKNGEIPIELANLMKKSLEFNKENYYVGIPCGCCEHKDNFRERLFNNYQINKINLTFASVFCNIMNFRFKNEIIPILKNYPIILVSNKKTNIQRMKDQGFNIIKWFSVDYNAWKNYQDIVDQVTNYQKEQNIVNHLFIFCAGPISNVIAYQLVQQEDKNIYLDIGSSLDEELGLGSGTRNHNKLFGWKTVSTCYWNKPTNWYQISCDSEEKSKLFRTLLRFFAFLYRIYNYVYSTITKIFLY